MATNKPTEDTTRTTEKEEKIESDTIFSFVSISKNIPLIPHLTNLYNYTLKGVSNKGIPLLLTALLYVVITGVWMLDTAIIYWGRDVIWWFYTTAEQQHIYWYLPLLGFAGLDPDDVRDRIDFIIEYVRVSSQSQSNKSGKQRQKNGINKEKTKISCDNTKEISDEWESASTMLRTNIDEIVETVRAHPNKTVALMLETTDRLSRAPPFEAATFLWILSRFDVIVYFGDQGYFDFSDPDQQMMAFFALYRSRQEFNKIKERTSSGQRQIKEQGGLPHQTPFGYSKVGDEKTDDKSHQVEIDKSEAKIISETVKRILEVEDPVVRSIWEDLKEEYEDDVKKFPEYPACFHILRNEKYTGKIKHNGEVVGSIPQIVSPEDYARVIEKIGMPSGSENDELDHVLQSVIERFGIDGSIQLFDIIKGRCPECGGDVETRGSAKRWGNRVLDYECIGAPPNFQEATEDESKNSGESDDDEADDDSGPAEGCGFNEPLLNEDFLKDWECGLPIVCPRCQTPADEDEWERSDIKLNVVEQTCNECGLWYSADVSTDYDSPLTRGMDFPDHAIRWFDDTDMESDNESGDQQSTDSKGTDTDQEELNSFN